MGKSEYKPHRFSVKDTALLLGISRSYLGTLEHEHSMTARRTERGKPFYTASDIAILREMGVGKRLKRLRPTGEAMRRLGLYSFGMELHESNPLAMLQAEAAKPMEERELERLRAIQEEARRQRARERSEEAARQKALKWREEAEQRTREWRANKKESPEAAETTAEQPESAEPRSAEGGAQTATDSPQVGDAKRPWWRRVFRG